MGDVYALMVEYWYEQRNAQEAYKLIEQVGGGGCGGEREQQTAVRG